MISLELARKLKEAGLAWAPVKNDFFAIPDRGMDEKVFVITDMTILVRYLRGELSVTFHGTPEWALDYIFVSELIWLPHESQLRERLEELLISEPQPALTLICAADGYASRIQFQAQYIEFEAFGASDAYGLALLYVMAHQS